MNVAPESVIAYIPTRTGRDLAMSDVALDNAKAKRELLFGRREQVKAELASIDKELAVIDDFIHNWMVFAGVNNGENMNNGGTDTEPVSPLRGHKPRIRKNSKKDAIASEVRKIIEENGAPVLRKDLLPVLVNRGYTIEGGDPDMVLSTMLWRAGKDAGVVRLKKGGYWLKEKPWLEAGYDPNFTVELDKEFLQLV